jgi:hypothetical protein
LEDYEEVDTEVFLRLIYEDVQGFAYLDSLAGEPRSFYLPAYLTDLVEEATWSLGGNLYCSTNTFTDGRIEHYTDDEGKRKIHTGRQKANAKEGRAIYCDADTAHPDVFRLKPSLIVESSPGRYQTWWLLDAVYPATRIALVSRQIAYAHNSEGADISSSSLTKLLRVPGSRNEKRNRETGEYVHASLPTVRAWDTGARYTMEEIEAKYEDIEFIRSLLPEGEDVELPDRAHLPKFPDLYDRLPEFSGVGTDLPALIESTGWLDESGDRKEGPAGDRTRYRYRLICDLLRAGFTNEETLVLTWGSKSADKWKADPRGERGLWGEILKARIEINGEQGQGLDAIEADTAYQHSDMGVALLSDEERASIQGDPHFINRYLTWVQSRLKRANLPYHRLNAWMVLSVAYAELTKIPDESADRPLNFFLMLLGETATGKTDASNLLFEALHHVHEDGFWGDGVSLGGDATPAALSRELVNRDKKVSVLHADEAHGALLVAQKADYQAGIVQRWTFLYDGRVPKAQRMTSPESSKDAETIFNVWFMGPPRAMADAMPAAWFDTGFMGRFMVAFGNPPEPDRKTVVRRREGDLTEKRVDPFVEQLREEADFNREEFQNRGMPYLDESDEALVRLGAAVDAIVAFSNGHQRLKDPLVKASRRMELHMRKAAWLLALSEASPVVTRRHMLIAIEAAEGWMSALVELANMVSTSDYAKQANQIERAIQENGGWMATAKLWRQFGDLDFRTKTQLIEELAKQNRIRSEARNSVPGYRTADQ